MAKNKIKRLRDSAKIEYIDRKSLFIGFATVVKSEEEALSIIKSKKKEYSDVQQTDSNYRTYQY